MDTKQQITKRRIHKTATTTKQRLLQNDDCYKTTKIIQKNLPNFFFENLRFPNFLIKNDYSQLEITIKYRLLLGIKLQTHIHSIY